MGLGGVWGGEGGMVGKREMEEGELGRKKGSQSMMGRSGE